MMHKLIRISALVAAIHASFSASLPGRARACSLLLPEEQIPYEDGETNDTTPPGVPELGEITVYRRPSASSQSGCGGGSQSSCDGSGSIRIEVGAPADDETPGSGMGYVVDVMGTGISDRELPEVAMLADDNGILWLHFDDRGQEIDVTLSVRARDLSRNIGEPAMVDVISDADASGCSAGADSGPMTLALVILALSVTLRRRRGVFAG